MDKFIGIKKKDFQSFKLTKEEAALIKEQEEKERLLREELEQKSREAEEKIKQAAEEEKEKASTHSVSYLSISICLLKKDQVLAGN